MNCLFNVWFRFIYFKLVSFRYKIQDFCCDVGAFRCNLSAFCFDFLSKRVEILFPNFDFVVLNTVIVSFPFKNCLKVSPSIFHEGHHIKNTKKKSHYCSLNRLLNTSYPFFAPGIFLAFTKTKIITS